MRVYWTSKGVLVYGEGTMWRFRGREWQVPCWRTDTGRWHGWVPLYNLDEVSTGWC